MIVTGASFGPREGESPAAMTLLVPSAARVERGGKTRSTRWRTTRSVTHRPVTALFTCAFRFIPFSSLSAATPHQRERPWSTMLSVQSRHAIARDEVFHDRTASVSSWGKLLDA